MRERCWGKAFAREGAFGAPEYDIGALAEAVVVASISKVVQFDAGVQ